MTDRKQPGVTLWITVALLAVLVGYPLSIGPAWWLWVKIGTPDWLRNVLNDFYAPLWSVLFYGPDWLHSWFVWYAGY